MLGGMVAGAVTMFVIWWTGVLAWTWYALAGAATTILIALVLARVPALRAKSDGAFDRLPNVIQ
jgi:hypothetical protein